MPLNLTKQFSGKNILITGAGSGLGLALTRAFLQCNAQVLATDADEGTMCFNR